MITGAASIHVLITGLITTYYYILAVNDTRATMPSTATEILHDLLGALDPEKHVEPLHPSRNPLHMHLRGKPLNEKAIFMKLRVVNS